MRQFEEKIMKHAVGLALQGWGETSPNPMVGAVVVKARKIVGRGYHKCAGADHAEVAALKKAGSKAKDATLYVTLEPCSHYGRTPPCTESIINAGIKKVVIGSRDPNPVVNGRGISILKKAGVEVKTGVLKDACMDINLPYETYVREKRPFVILKTAISLDGKIATEGGDSKWITSKLCRDYVHQIRNGVDAILVGGGTIRKDNPRLSVRLPGKNHRKGLVVVVDERLNLPTESKIFKRKPKELLLATTCNASASKINWMKRRGYDVIVCKENKRGYVFLPQLMRELAKREITSVLVEGGGEINTDFVSQGLVDRFVACIAPKLIGGEGYNMLPGLSINKMKSALKLKDVTIKTIGEDTIIEASF